MMMMKSHKLNCTFATLLRNNRMAPYIPTKAKPTSAELFLYFGQQAAGCTDVAVAQRLF